MTLGLLLPKPIGLRIGATVTLMAMSILAIPYVAHSQQSEPQSAAIEVPKVSVTDSVSGQPADGTRSQGYSTKTVTSVGPWGRMDKLDAPYSFTVIPGVLIEDTMASTPNDIFKLMPFSQTTTGTRYGYGAQVQMRGYDSSIELIDGFRTNVGFQSPEMYDRVEILSGAGGFLYGNAVPGGVINAVQKRPTFTNFAEVAAGDFGGSQAFVQGDFGGTIGSGANVGYRINALASGGETAIDIEHSHRRFVSGALDVKTGANSILQLDASYEYYKTTGKIAAVFFLYDVGPFITPDNKQSFGQPWDYASAETTSVDLKYQIRLLDNLDSRTGVMYRHQLEASIDAFALVDTDGSYSSLAANNDGQLDEQISYYQYFDLNFSTSTVQHRLTLGLSGDHDTYQVSDVWWNTGVPTVATGNVYDGPTYAPYPGPDGFGVAGQSTSPNRPFRDASNMNVSIGDQIRFTDMYSLLLGVNHATLKEEDFNPTTGEYRQLPYDRSRNSPTASFVIKPSEQTSVYLTYMEALEQGGIAPSDAVNKDEVMPPFVSREWELGAKANLANVNYTLALFSIDKAYAYSNAQNVYVEDGRQKDTGIELGIYGKVMDELTLFGGATHVTPKVTGGSDDGLVPVRISKNIAKVRAEYDIRPLPGFTVVGGLQYYGPWYWNDANTLQAPSTTLTDLGLRYRTAAWGPAVTFSIDVNNVFGKSYYSSVGYLGDPRSVAFSVRAKF